MKLLLFWIILVGLINKCHAMDKFMIKKVVEAISKTEIGTSVRNRVEEQAKKVANDAMLTALGAAATTVQTHEISTEKLTRCSIDGIKIGLDDRYNYVTKEARTSVVVSWSFP